MKYIFRLSTLLLGISLGASAVFVYQHIRTQTKLSPIPERTDTHQPISTASITEITLKRTECYGACPTYRVVLRRDGTATYVGEANVQRKGKYKGKVYEYSFNRLAELMQSHGYAGIDFNDKNAVCEDSPHAITSVLYSDGKRQIIDKDECIEGMPELAERAAKLWEIETAIDGVAANIDWQPDK